MTVTYDYQLSTSADEADVIDDQTGLSSSTYTPGAPLADDDYYWRYRKHTTLGVSPWSPWRVLHLLQLPATPTLSTPGSAAYTDDSTPTFDWDDAARATTYEFQLDDDPAFGSPLLDVTGLASSTHTATTTPDGDYYWRARGRNGTGAGSWSAGRLLHILQLPAAPVLSAPSSGFYASLESTVFPTYSWAAAARATTYRWELASDAGFSTIVASQSGIATTNYTPASHPGAGTYYWRIVAVNGSGETASSGRAVVYADPIYTRLAGRSNRAAYWRLNDASGILGTVDNPAVSEGRNLVAGTNSTFSGAGSWTNTGLATFNVNSTVAGKAYLLGDGGNDYMSLTSIFTIGLLYKVTLKARLNTGGSTQIFAGSDLVTGTARIAFTPTGTETTFTDYILAGSTTLFVGSTAGFNGVAFEIDDVAVQQVGIRASSDYPRLDLIKNGSFNYSGAAWTLGTNWTAGSGSAAATAGAGDLGYAGASFIVGRQYDVTFTLTRSAGQIRAQVGGTGTGTYRNASGTYTETITGAGSTTFIFHPDASFVGSITGVSVVPHDSQVLWDGVSTYGNWTVVNAATLSNPSAGVLRTAYNGTSSPFARQSGLKAGSTYRLKITATPSASLTVLARQNSTNVISQAISTATVIETTFVATGTPFDLGISGGSAGQYVDWSSVTLEEIAPMSAVALNGVSLNQTSGVALADPVSKLDGTNDLWNAFSAQFNSVADPTGSFTFQIYAKADSGSPASQNTLVTIQTDLSNRLVIDLTSTSGWRFRWIAGGTTATVTTGAGTGDTNPHLFTIVVDSGTMYAYLDKALVGSASAGTWAGNLSSTAVTFGSSGTGAASPAAAYIGHAFWENIAIDAAEVTARAQLIGVAA